MNALEQRVGRWGDGESGRVEEWESGGVEE
jgi:hypothetical protein